MISKISNLKNVINRKLHTKRKVRSKKAVSNNSASLPKIVISGRNQFIGRALLILLISLIFFLLVDFIKFYIQYDFDKFPDYESEEHTWNGSERMNIAIIGIDRKDTGHVFVDYASVLHLSPGSPSLGIFSINTKFETELPNGDEASIRLSYLKGLEESDPLGYVVSGIENLIGVKVQKYILIDNNQAKVLLQTFPRGKVEVAEDLVDPDFEPIYEGTYDLSPDEMYHFLGSDILGEDSRLQRNVDFLKDQIKTLENFTNLFKYQQILGAIKDNTYTNISKEEMIRIAFYIRGLRDDQIIIAYTEEKSGIKSDDDYFLWYTESDDIDADLKSILINQKVRLEQAKIEVLNASKQSGIASSKGRWIENIGGRVIRVGNTPDEYDKNYIFVKNPEKYPETLKEIVATFDKEVRVLREEYPNRHVGEIIVVIGEP